MEFNKLVEDYGCLAFTDDVMKERIPKSTYKAFHESLDKGRFPSTHRPHYADVNIASGSPGNFLINLIVIHAITSRLPLMGDEQQLTRFCRLLFHSVRLLNLSDGCSIGLRNVPQRPPINHLAQHD